MRVIKTEKLKNVQFNPSLFVPIRGGTELDKIWSTKEGVMPGTITMCIGDPGIGKSTILMDYLTKIQNLNPDKKICFVSAEMNRLDLKEYTERIPEIDDLEILFLGDYVDNDPKSALEDLLSQGWDIVLLDSFQDISDILCDEQEYKFSTKKAETYLCDLFKRVSEGDNDEEIFTAIISIQQVTKGGTFRGSNKIKHNCTAFLEVRYDDFDNTVMYFSKNRRGQKNVELKWKFVPKGIEYEPLEKRKEIRKPDAMVELEASLENEQKTLKKMFGYKSEAA